MVELPGRSVCSQADSSPGHRPTDRLSRLVAGMLITAMVLSLACGSENGNPVESDVNECQAEQWDIDTGGAYAYSHDCRPFVGNHFTVYSDGSSTAAKSFLAGLAEGAFEELVTEFLVQSVDEELRFTPGYTYYIYAQKHMPIIKAMGFRNGFFIAAIDCATIPDPYTRNPAFYMYLVRHELTHVFQFTLTDCPRNSACPYWLGVWFREGQAICMGDHPGGMIIDSLEEYRQWVAGPGHINPISIHRWTDFPDPDSAGEYYPMFGLAYAYLIDMEHGYGATMEDMRELFRLMATGDGFEEAFGKVLGVSVPWYRENFHSLMEQYLSNAGGKTPLDLEAKMGFFKEMREEYPINPK